MAKKIGRSEENGHGGFTHYDKKGHKIGRTEQKSWSGYTHYAASGSGCALPVLLILLIAAAVLFGAG